MARLPYIMSHVTINIMSGTADIPHIPQAKRAQAIHSRGRPPTGSAQSPAQRMRRYRERQRAAGVDGLGPFGLRNMGDIGGAGHDVYRNM